MGLLLYEEKLIMDPSDSRADQTREAENTSGSKWRRGWSYLRQYSGVLGKSLDEDTANEDTTKHLNAEVPFPQDQLHLMIS
jgi:hypothetical protein